jgi:hypothetical protein
MRLSTLPFVLLGLGACTAQSGNSGHDGSSIFREVQFDPYAPVTLGQPLPERAPRTVGRADLLAFAEAGFGGTDSIYLALSADRGVTAMYFVYPDTTNFAAAISSYEESLGAPVTRTTLDSAGGRVEHIVWEDTVTRFIMGRYVSSAGTQRVSSALIDRSTPR